MKSRAPIFAVFLVAVLAIVAWTAWSQLGPGPVSAGLVSAPEAVRISMLYGSEKRDWIEAAHAQFVKAHPEVEVDLVSMGSLQGAQAILDGQHKPTVFSPADTLVLNLLRSDWEAKHRGSPYSPSFTPEPLVITPLVFAAWEDRGLLIEKAGGGHFAWKPIRDALVDNRGWPALGGPPDWGFVKLGHTDPTQSNSGLQALVLMTMEFHGRTALTVADVLDPAYQTWMAEIERGVPRFEDSTGTFMTDMIRFGPSKYDLALVYEATAVAQIENAQGRWGNLRLWYPTTTMWSDHPVAVLTEGVTEEQAAAARVWIDWLRSEPMQQMALSYGFRPGNPNVAIQTADAGNPFVKYSQYGLRLDIPPVAPAPDGAVLRNLLTLWSRSVKRWRAPRAGGDQAAEIRDGVDARIIPLRDGRILLDQALVVRADQRFALSPIEEKLLRYLFDQPGRVVGRDELLVEVWGYRPGVQSRTIDNTVLRLRHKIEVDPASPVHLQSIYGRGLKLVLGEPGGGLIGRDAELGRVREAFEGGARLISLTGPPGAGKTRLAEEIAQLETGLLAVSLRVALTDSDAWTLIGAALSLVPADPERFGAALAERQRPLLLLDSAERVMPWLAPAVAQWLAAAPQLRVLITSRVPAGLAEEVRIEVGPLAEEAAMALFRERARRVAPQLQVDDAALAELVRGLDGLPLALELAAARAGVLPVRQMVARLPRRLDLVDGMRASLDQSLQDLPSSCTAALSALAVFAGSFTLDDAEGVLGDPRVLDAIQQLAERGLLAARVGPADAPATYTLYEVVRDRVREVQPAWFARLGERPWEPEAMPRLRAAFGELRSALERWWGPDPVLAGRCGAALAVLWVDDGPLAAGRDLVQRLAPLELPPEVRVSLLTQEASLELAAARTDEGARLLERALALETDPHRRVFLRLMRVQVWRGGGRLDDAAAELQALEGEPLPAWLACRYHVQAGYVWAMRSDLARAEAELLRGRERAEEVPDPKVDCYCADGLAIVLGLQGRLTEAAALSRQALASPFTQRNEAWCHHQLAQIESARGRLEEAHEALERAEALHRIAGNSRDLLTTGTLRAFLLGQAGRTLEGEAAVVELLNRSPRHPSQGNTWNVLCELAILNERYGEARRALQIAQEMAEQGQREALKLELVRWQGLLLVQEGELGQARQVWADSEPRLARFPLARQLSAAAYAEARWGEVSRSRELQQQTEALASVLELGEASPVVQWLERARHQARLRSPRLVSG
jgi:tetratricopeptide (TPR) repeat protein